ncbi:MAG: hypothetical protein Q9211_003714 [Gyalolechia sp. 1 TL-2023]
MCMSTEVFEFHHASAVCATLHAIAPWCYHWIRHLSFILDSDNDGWLPFFKNELPPTVRAVRLDMNHAQHEWAHEQYLGIVAKNCTEADCRVGRYQSTKRSLTRRCKHYNNLSFLAKKFERDIVLLEIVMKILTRNAPLATIRLGMTNEECRLCYDKCVKLGEEAFSNGDTGIPRLRSFQVTGQ